MDPGVKGMGTGSRGVRNPKEVGRGAGGGVGSGVDGNFENPVGERDT